MQLKAKVEANNDKKNKEREAGYYNKELLVEDVYHPEGEFGEVINKKEC